MQRWSESLHCKASKDCSGIGENEPYSCSIPAFAIGVIEPFQNFGLLLSGRTSIGELMVAANISFLAHNGLFEFARL
jgi:hypothetical protein